MLMSYDIPTHHPFDRKDRLHNFEKDFVWITIKVKQRLGPRTFK